MIVKAINKFSMEQFPIQISSIFAQAKIIFFFFSGREKSILGNGSLAVRPPIGRLFACRAVHLKFEISTRLLTQFI